MKRKTTQRHLENRYFYATLWLNMPLRINFFFVLLLCSKQVLSQSIVDPCFTSIEKTGKYQGSKDLINLCGCITDYEASDLMEWDGSKWVGALNPDIVKPPPVGGCNVRAIWMGYELWTAGGEGFALRLDKPLEGGKTYTFTFTYAKDGHKGSQLEAENFSPYVYTGRHYPAFETASFVGRLPGAVDWKTGSVTFKAQGVQTGHDWLLFRTFDCSGTIMSNCNIEEPIEQVFLPRDTTLCLGDAALLHAPQNERYKYLWSTGETTPTITASTPGLYSVEIENYHCFSRDSVYLEFEDCEVRFEMPNIFTPNGDEYNQTFVPKEFNYIDKGTLTIYNRWGNKLFSGDLLAGWDGKSHGSPVVSGVYFYNIHYSDKYGTKHVKQGTVTVAR